MKSLVLMMVLAFSFNTIAKISTSFTEEQAILATAKNTELLVSVKKLAKAAAFKGLTVERKSTTLFHVTVLTLDDVNRICSTLVEVKPTLKKVGPGNSITVSELEATRKISNPKCTY